MPPQPFTIFALYKLLQHEKDVVDIYIEPYWFIQLSKELADQGADSQGQYLCWLTYKIRSLPFPKAIVVQRNSKDLDLFEAKRIGVID